MTKRCTKCGQEKDEDEFANKRGKKASVCKECHNYYYREYWRGTEAYEKHKRRVADNKIKARANKYGLSVTQMKYLLSQNNGLCFLCNERISEVVDHCHSTGEVRGALCRNCNSGLGLLGDTPEALDRAAKYLAGVSVLPYK